MTVVPCKKSLSEWSKDLVPGGWVRIPHLLFLNFTKYIKVAFFVILKIVIRLGEDGREN